MPEQYIPWLPIAAPAAGALLLLIIVLVILFRRGPAETATDRAADRSIRVGDLPQSAPRAAGPVLTFYNVPVRLSVLVMAPVGRSGEIPPQEELPNIVEQLLPGLMQVLAADQPIFRRWPAQLSSQGFAQAFFNNVPLPGDRGKGTVWCSIAGKFEADGQAYLAGLVCQSENPNSLNEVTAQQIGDWLDVLRVQSVG